MSASEADPHHQVFRSVKTNAARATIFGQIEAERSRQILQWGGEDHDDGHRRGMWSRLITEHVDRARKFIRLRSGSAADSWRHRLIVIAALCVAAVESHDRKQRR